MKGSGMHAGTWTGLAGSFSVLNLIQTPCLSDLSWLEKVTILLLLVILFQKKNYCNFIPLIIYALQECEKKQHCLMKGHIIYSNSLFIIIIINSKVHSSVPRQIKVDALYII